MARGKQVEDKEITNIAPVEGVEKEAESTEGNPAGNTEETPKPERFFKIAKGIMTVKGAVKSPGHIISEHQLNTDADLLVKSGIIVEVKEPKK